MTAPGVARFEGCGPVTLDQAKSFLSDCQVTIKPVIDLATRPPSTLMRSPVDVFPYATYLRSPVDVFPYATNSSRRPRLRPHRPLP
jgi:hypothetical protein